MTAVLERPTLALPSGAEQVLPPDAPRAVWLAERRKSIGGSDASTLVKLNPYGSPMQLWLDKTGQLPPLTITSAIEWGVLLEPVVREWVAKTYKLQIVRAGMFRRPGHPRVHANPDGIQIDPDTGLPVAGIEIKTTSWRQAHEWADGQCPDHAELQAQLCMFVTGLRRWWIVGLIDGRDPQVRMLHADDELGAMLADEAAKFYRVHIDPMAPPALDDSEATNDAIRAALSQPVDGKAVALTPKLAGLFRVWVEAGDRVRAAKAAEREADSALRMALGDAAVIVDNPALPADLEPKEGGRTVYATAINNGTFAPSRFVEAEPEMAEEFTIDRPGLDVSALKTKRPDTYRAHCARVIRPRKTLADALTTTPTPTPTPTTEETP